MARSSPGQRREYEDASRRTRLASERTQLAWWRTGLTAIAVAIGVGRIVPGLAHSATRWPYAALGVLFAAYAVCLFAYGSIRYRSVEDALDEHAYRELPNSAVIALTVFGVFLCAATAALIAVD